jgi:signal transduction histidine kinase
MSPTNGEPTLDVSFLYLCEDGAAWVIGNGRVRKARARQWVQEAEACRGVFTGRLDRIGVQEDRRGGAWLYHYGKGIFHLRPTGQTRQIADEENFPGERVDCFFQDREANLWAGVDRGGLVRLREKRFTVWAPDDSPAKAAVSVAEDAQGGVWIGTYGAGLYRWHDGAWQSFGVPEGTRRGFVFSVCPDRAGRLWASAGEEDLYLGDQGQFKPVTPAVHGVKALLAAHDGRVWVGTKSRLFCWSEQETQQLQSIEGVSRTDVRALAEDTQGVIWAGMGDGTLYRVESNRVASFRPRDQWATQPIWSLSADPDGSVWAGTFRGGLLRFRDGNFIRYTTKQGLPDDVICQILDDEEGRLWLGSQQGIFCVEKSDLNNCAQGKARAVNCTAYGRYDGLPSLECSGSYQPAAWRGHDGRLFFATLRGVVSVRPEDLSSNRLPPPVVIERVLVDGQRAEDKAGKQVFGDSSLDVVEVGPGKRQLEFQYTGLSFVSPDRVRFRYQLDGFDKDWVEAGSRRWVQYGFLRPGTYTFRVKACNNDGVWNSRGASLLLRVSPHFYETTWFLGLAGCAIIGGVAAGARAVSTRKYRRALALLEQQHAIERDRARIARDIHDDLGAGLTRITLLSELARREPPDQAGGHLDRISSSARELTRTMDEIVWAVDPQHDTLNGLMDYASAYTEDYLRLAGIRCRMDLPSALPLVQVAAESRYNLFLALKEALNNIVKHAHASEVWLRLRLAPGRFTLVLEDNGQGLATASPSSNNPGGNAESGERLYSGHGLGNLEQRLAAIGGSCAVRSAPGQGTRIEMTIHLPGRASPIVATGQNGDGHSQ